MAKQYKYHQSSTSLSANLKFAADMFNRCDLPLKLIDCYNAIKQKDIKKLKDIPQRIVDLLEPIPPNRFIQEIDALQYPRNDTGIENSLVYKEFWSSISINDQILLINPHITFLKGCKYNLHRLTVTYTDKEKVTLLSLIRGYDKYHPTPLPRLNKSQKFTRVLYFVRDSDPNEVITTLEHIRPYLAANDVSIHILLPNVYLDRNNSQNELRQYIFCKNSVEKIVLFDENTANIAPKKKCYITLTPEACSKPDKILIEYAEYQSKNHQKFLLVNQRIEIDYGFLQNTSVTLQNAFRASISPPGSEKRKEPQKYIFSKEIEIFCTTFNSDGAWRGKYSIHQPPTQKQLARNPYSTGKIVGKQVTSKCLPTEAEALYYSEEIAFQKEAFSEIIRNRISKIAADQSISLKSLWYLYLEALKEQSEYNHDFCRSVFKRPDSANSALCSLMVGEAGIDEIAAAVSDYVQREAIPDANEAKLWCQLELIFDIAVKMKHAKVNPIRQRNIDADEETHKYNKMRSNLVLGSYDQTSASRLATKVLAFGGSLSLLIGFLLQFFEGMLAGEICALTWGDYQKVTNMNLYQLRVNKSFDQTGFTAKTLRTKWQYRVIPLIGLIHNLLKKHKADCLRMLESLGDNSLTIDDCPILHSPEDPRKPISTRALNRFCAEIMEQEEIAQHFITANKRGKEKTTDINHKQANMLQSNFEYHAAHSAMLTPDEIAYMRGKKPITTAGQHYCGYTSSRGQLALAVKLEDWAAQIMNEDLSGVLCYNNGNLSSKQIHIKPKNTLTEITIDVVAAVETEQWAEFQIKTKYGADVFIDQIKEVH